MYYKKKQRSNFGQQAFDNVKCGLFSSPVLAAPCTDRPFKLRADATDVAVGAVVSK